MEKERRFKVVGVKKGTYYIGDVFRLKHQDGKFNLSFDNLDLIGDLIWSGIANAEGGETAVTSKDCVDAFFDDVEKVQEVFELFMASMPKAKETPASKKKVARKK